MANLGSPRGLRLLPSADDPLPQEPKRSLRARAETARVRGIALRAQLEEQRPEHVSVETGFRWLYRDKEIAGGVLGGGLAYPLLLLDAGSRRPHCRRPRVRFCVRSRCRCGLPGSRCHELAGHDGRDGCRAIRDGTVVARPLGHSPRALVELHAAASAPFGACGGLARHPAATSQGAERDRDPARGSRRAAGRRSSSRLGAGAYGRRRRPCRDRRHRGCVRRHVALGVDATPFTQGSVDRVLAGGRALRSRARGNARLHRRLRK